MQEELGRIVVELLHEIVSIDSQYILFAVILVCAVIVIDAVSAFISREKKQSGVANATAVSIDGAKTLQVRDYISSLQGLAGRPDALINENGNIIPVERKPMSRKVRDRHVAQILVYMRLVEEFEGKKPPYGYIILGKSCRQVKIKNTPEKQAWLQKMLDEMRAHLEQQEPVEPAPHPRKCKKCPVRGSCEHKVHAPDKTSARDASTTIVSLKKKPSRKSSERQELKQANAK